MSKPTKCISVQEAKDLQDNWVSTRGVNINKSQKEDCREVFYTIEELEEYLSFVKKESAKQGFNNPGIRIYFAAYNNKKSKKATVFLSPTKNDDEDSENNYDIPPFNQGGSGWPPVNY